MVSENADWKKIGDRLRVAREYLELTQEEAAKGVNISRSALSQIERGHRKVDAVELSNFARLYGQSIDALTGTVDTEAPQSIQALARSAKSLTEQDMAELIRFAEFLKARSSKDGAGG